MFTKLYYNYYIRINNTLLKFYAWIIDSLKIKNALNKLFLTLSIFFMFLLNMVNSQIDIFFYTFFLNY